MISETDIETIRNYYHARDHNNDYKKGNLGFGFIHYALIRNLRPKRILVVGSQKGYVPAICALACKHEKRGFVHFVDAGKELKDENSWGGIGVWKKATDEYWKPLGVEKHIKLFCETTESFAVALKSSPVRYGYIYIDGDHSYKGVKRDYKLFWPYLKKGGLMVLHDVLEDKMTDYGRCGVKKWWEKIEKKKYFRHIKINRSVGLGIIEK